MKTEYKTLKLKPIHLWNNHIILFKKRRVVVKKKIVNKMNKIMTKIYKMYNINKFMKTIKIREKAIMNKVKKKKMMMMMKNI